MFLEIFPVVTVNYPSHSWGFEATEKFPHWESSGAAMSEMVWLMSVCPGQCSSTHRLRNRIKALAWSSMRSCIPCLSLPYSRILHLGCQRWDIPFGRLSLHHKTFLLFQVSLCLPPILIAGRALRSADPTIPSFLI